MDQCLLDSIEICHYLFFNSVETSIYLTRGLCELGGYLWIFIHAELLLAVKAFRAR